MQAPPAGPLETSRDPRSPRARRRSASSRGAGHFPESTPGATMLAPHTSEDDAVNDRGRLLIACAALIFGSSLFAQQLDGEWVGGYQDGRNYVYLTPSFVTENGTTSGRASIPLQRRRNLPLAELRFDGRELSFVLAERGGSHRIRAELEGDVVSGTADLGGRSVPFHLVRNVPVSGERLASLGGLYQLADGTLFGFIGGGELGFPSYVDFGREEHRSLWPLSDSEFAI